MSNEINAAINHNVEVTLLRASIAHIVQVIAVDSTLDLTDLPPVIGKGAAELYVLARDHHRGWNALAALAISEIQHLKSALAAERKEVAEQNALIAQLSEDNEYLQELLNNRWEEIRELREELASAERSYERLRNANVALGSANTSASNEIERLRARMLEARRVLDI